jgi:hypothetical protein
MIPLRSAPLELLTLDRVRDDALVAAIFSDDRPPRGLAGLIDWRTDGSISRMAAKGRITGDNGECVLFAAKDRTACGFILFYGLGRRTDICAERVKSAAAEVGSKLRKAGVRRFAFSIPPYEGGGLSWTEALSVWLIEAAEGGWEGMTVIGDTGRIRKFGLSLSDMLRKKVAFTGRDET